MNFPMLHIARNININRDLPISNTTNVIHREVEKIENSMEITEEEETFYTFYFGEDIPFEEERTFYLNSSSWKEEYKGVKEVIRTMMEKYGYNDSIPCSDRDSEFEEHAVRYSLFASC